MCWEWNKTHATIMAFSSKSFISDWNNNTHAESLLNATDHDKSHTMHN